MLARMATLGEVMTKDVLSVAPEDTIGEAAQKMTNQGVGAVVVSDFGRMIGIFTERDLMRAVAARCAGGGARAWVDDAGSRDDDRGRVGRGGGRRR